MPARRLSGLIKLAAAAAVGATVAAGGAVAIGAPAPAPALPGAEPANLGLAKKDVQAYYGDSVGPDGKHRYSDASQWAADTERQVAGAKAFLAKRLAENVRNPAIVLDIDDTSQSTYGLEADNDFGFDNAKLERAIHDDALGPVKPTLQLAQWASRQGVKVFFVTGRKEHLGPDSVRGLLGNGYPQPAGAFFKPETTAPDYLPCGLKCSTVEYKSGTRAHIESQGSTIVLNLGDQQSDLTGDHAERPVKLPNPMYFLP